MFCDIFGAQKYSRRALPKIPYGTIAVKRYCFFFSSIFEHGCCCTNFLVYFRVYHDFCIYLYIGLIIQQIITVQRLKMRYCVKEGTQNNCIQKECENIILIKNTRCWLWIQKTVMSLICPALSYKKEHSIESKPPPPTYIISSMAFYHIQRLPYWKCSHLHLVHHNLSATHYSTYSTFNYYHDWPSCFIWHWGQNKIK